MPQLIRSPVIPMHREPDPLAEQVSQALLAMTVAVLERRDDWLRIATPDGYAGWVREDGVVDAPSTWQEPWVEVGDLWANFRARPDYRLAPVTWAPVGTRLPFTGGQEGWTAVRLPSGEQAWTESHRVGPPGRGRVSPAAIARTARRFLGVPYLWGGCSPAGLDCSGFVQLVLRLHGVEIMRDAHDQATEGEPSPEPDTADLVFFGPQGAVGAITHVGMMLDRDRFIHALGSDRVRINRLSEERWQRMLHGVRRYCRRDGA